MPDASSVVAVYSNHTDAEKAVAKLSAAAFDITKVSILGKDYHTEENVVGYYTAGDRMKSWGGIGAFWGGIWGLLLGAGFFLSQVSGRFWSVVPSWQRWLAPWNPQR